MLRSWERSWIFLLLTLKCYVKAYLCHLGLIVQLLSDSTCGLKTSGVKLQVLRTRLSDVEEHSQCHKLGQDWCRNGALSSVQLTQCSCFSLPPGFLMLEQPREEPVSSYSYPVGGWEPDLQSHGAHLWSTSHQQARCGHWGFKKTMPRDSCQLLCGS